MNREDLDKLAKGYFERNKELKAIYATDKGHFFYDRNSRQQFLNKLPEPQKPVDYFRDAISKGEALKDGLPEDCPSLKILVSKGFKSLAEVKAHPDLASIPGLGPGKVKEIQDFLKKFE